MPGGVIETITTFERYLEVLDRWQREGLARAYPELRTTVPGFLRRYGRWFETTPATFKGRRMKKHACYVNAGERAAFKGARYAEGYVVIGNVPIEHAWNLDADGRVVDPTLRPTNSYKRRYFGAELDVGFLTRVAGKSRRWSLLTYPNVIETLRDPEVALAKSEG